MGSVVGEVGGVHVVLGAGELAALREGVCVVRRPAAVFEVTGAGALDCLQGLLTNDLKAPGDGALVYGAVLTPKGMIVADFWVVREAGRFTLVTVPEARQVALDLFRRSLPPRLAKLADRSDTLETAWAIGAAAPEALGRCLGMPLPAAGRAARVATASGELLVASGTPAAYFAALAIGTPDALSVLDTLPAGSPDQLHAARILAGWPALGAEIDERTLVQEVRYDEIGGVSYTKGCYTGQETVARLHFRGHTNRDLRGLEWATLDPLVSDTVRQGDKEVGSVRSTLTADGRRVGLAKIRREVETGSEVVAGGVRARVVGVGGGRE